MKKQLVIIIFVFIFGLLGWMGYSSVSSLKTKEAKDSVKENLSSVLSSLKIDAITTSEKTILMYFNSECDHCHWEVKHLSENIHQFEGVNLMLVSLESADSATNFLEEYSLHDYFVQTRPEDIISIFDDEVPQIFIYEGNSLKRKFNGEVKMEIILDVFNK